MTPPPASSSALRPTRIKACGLVSSPALNSTKMAPISATEWIVSLGLIQPRAKGPSAIPATISPRTEGNRTLSNNSPATFAETKITRSCKRSWSGACGMTAPQHMGRYRYSQENQSRVPRPRLSALWIDRRGFPRLRSAQLIWQGKTDPACLCWFRILRSLAPPDSRGRRSPRCSLLDVTGRLSPFFEILLVVILCWMKRNCRNDLSHDRLLEAPRLLQLFFREPGFALLLRDVEKDRRAVLRSIVRTLAVELGGVVVLPEHLEQFLVGEFCGIVIYFDRLGVAGAVAAHVLIGRIGEVPAGVANPGCGNPRQLAESSFHSPETACGKGGFGHMDEL